MKKIMLFAVIALLCVVAFNACTNEVTQVTIEGLPEDLSSPTFALDGVLFTLPIAWAELEENGWMPYDDARNFERYSLEPGGDSIWALTNGAHLIAALFTNFSETTVPIGESVVTGIYAGDPIRNGPQVILPSGITLGATLEQVLAIYGDPDDSREFENLRSLILVFRGESFTLEMTFDSANRATIIVLHYNKVPQVTIEGLPEDLSSPTFALDGVLFTLPIAWAELAENGWMPYDEYPSFAEDILTPRWQEWRITNGTHLLHVRFSTVFNETLRAYEAVLNDITIFDQPHFDHQAEVVFTGDITLGSTYQDVLAAYGTPLRRSDLTDSRGKILTFSWRSFQLMLEFDDTDRVTRIGMNSRR